MKQLTRYAVLLLGMALLLASCQKAPELTITSSPTVELNVDGSSGTITFTANRAWTVSSSDSWVTISPSSGEASDKPVTVTVRCNANTTYDDRTATVTIRMEDLSQSVTIKQPANKGVVLPKQVFDLQSDAKSIDVEVQANVQYMVSTSVDWIIQTDTKGLTPKILTFSIEENTSYDPREGEITIKPQDSNVLDQIISIRQTGKPIPNGAVDLGMEFLREDGSSYRLFWAECNLGASSPEDYGDYYAWGEIAPKDYYSWATYRFCSSVSNYDTPLRLSKYNIFDWMGPVDNKMMLDPEDDAAHLILGAAWRIPTASEMNGLINQCTWSWTTMNGIEGFIIESKTNGNSIFLPAAGEVVGSSVFIQGDVGGVGQYWTSSLCDVRPGNAERLYFYDGCSGAIISHGRCYGRLIRPVTE